MTTAAHRNHRMVFNNICFKSASVTNDIKDYLIAESGCIAMAALFYSPVDSPMHQTCIRVMHV